MAMSGPDTLCSLSTWCPFCGSFLLFCVDFCGARRRFRMRADAALLSLSLPLRLVWFAPSALQHRSCPLNLPPPPPFPFLKKISASALISFELGHFSGHALKELSADSTGAGRRYTKIKPAVIMLHYWSGCTVGQDAEGMSLAVTLGGVGLFFHGP